MAREKGSAMPGNNDPGDPISASSEVCAVAPKPKCYGQEPCCLDSRLVELLSTTVELRLL
jgi:hypothetical protein